MRIDPLKIRLIATDRIRVVNPRAREPKKFEQIVESISLLGLKKPITVTLAPADEQGRECFDLVCGQGRLEACIALGERQIPAVVRGDMSKTDGLLASLVENIARRRVPALDQIKLIQWMNDQGHDAAAIGRKTGLGEGYLKQILGLLRNGEDRLLEAVLHGSVPISLATKIAGVPDDESQRMLVQAYELKELTQKSLGAFKRILDQRRHFGKTYGERGGKVTSKTSADSLVRAYQKESQRQRLMVRKAKTCEARLLSLGAAFKVLIADEDFTNLLRAEDLDTMPRFLADRAKEAR